MVIFCIRTNGTVPDPGCADNFQVGSPSVLATSFSLETARKRVAIEVPTPGPYGWWRKRATSCHSEQFSRPKAGHVRSIRRQLARRSRCQSHLPPYRDASHIRLHSAYRYCPQEMQALQRPVPCLVRLSRFPTLSCQPARRTPSGKSFATHASQGAAAPRTERKLRMILLGAPVSNASSRSGHLTR